jgi:hypothetical protein
MGVIVSGCFNVALVDYNQYQHNANHVLSVLYAVLYDLACGGAANGKVPTEKFPRKLFLQLDNVTGQNKNAAMMRFCGVLIHMRIFDEVLLFLLNCLDNHALQSCRPHS